MNNYIIPMLLSAIFIVLINALYIAWTIENREKTEKLYYCENGDYRGQVHNIKDWRKIAIELSKTVKNSRLNAMAKHGTDEDVIGLLYLEFGVELCDW